MKTKIFPKMCLDLKMICISIPSKIIHFKSYKVDTFYKTVCAKKLFFWIIYKKSVRKYFFPILKYTF